MTDSTADPSNSTKHELSTVTIAINTLLFGFILIWISVGILQEWNETIRRSFRRFARWIARWKLRWRLLSQRDDSNTATDISTTITISEIYIYPVKSLRGISLQKTQLDALGFRYDRHWMVVRPIITQQQEPGFGATSINTSSVVSDTTTHRFVSQRQIPTLAQIDVSLVLIDSKEDEYTVELSYKDQKVRVPATSSLLQQGKGRHQVGVWEDKVSVLDCGDEVANFLQNVLDANTTDGEQDATGTSTICTAGLRLVTMDPQRYQRFIKESYTPFVAFDKFGYPPMTSLTDGFPILIATGKSLEELNERILIKKDLRPKQQQEEEKYPSSSIISNNIPMNRFRPNLVIKGTTRPFEEDGWKIIRIGNSTCTTSSTLLLFIVKGCPRCKQSTTDQITGEVDIRNKEPLTTLGEFRKFGRNGDVFFAQNALFVQLSSAKQPNEDTIHVGDMIEIIETGNPIYE